MAASGALATGALLFGVYADLAYNLFSANNSSPQTTELFAGDRAATLWKYVKISDVQLAAFGLFGSLLAGSLWPLIAVSTVGVGMHLMYRHALKAGGGEC